MDNLTHSFRLSFLTNRNENLIINVPRADSFLNDPQVVQAMSGIIDSGVVLGAGGEPRLRQSADLVTTERTAFNLFV